MSALSHPCSLHPSKPISHYCESCKDLVCELCIQKQPHSGSTHQIITLEESANIRRNHYQHYVVTQVNPMREMADERLDRLEQLQQEMTHNRKVIEKDINIEFEGIASRLEGYLQQKTLKRQTDIKHMQQFVQSLDDLNEAFDSIYQNPQALLLSYKSLDRQIKDLQSKQQSIIPSEEQKDEQLPRQCAQIQCRLATLPQHEQKTAFMNRLIEKTIKEYKAMVEREKKNTIMREKEIHRNYNDILEKMARIQVAKVCVFCGCPFTFDNVNETCSNNRTFKISSVYPGVAWEEIIPEDVRGSKRHFWHKSDVVHRQKPQLESHSLIRNTSKKHFLNSLLELEAVKYCMKRKEIETGKTFMQMIANNDPNKTGFISKVAFTYVMSREYGVNKTQIQSMISYLQEDRGIPVEKFISMLECPTEEYNKFVEAEQEMEKSKPVAPTSAASKYRY